MSDTPPPPIVVPPPVRRSRRSWRLIWPLLGVLSFVVVTIVVQGIQHVMPIVSQVPPPIVGFGKTQRIRKFAKGWAEYSFRDLELRIALPTAPKTQSFQWALQDRLVIKEWANYQADRVPLSINLEAYAYRSDVALESLAEGQTKLRQSDPFLKQVRSTTQRKRLSYRNALLHTITWMEDGFDATECIYYCDMNGRVLVLRFSYWQIDRKVSEREVKRIVNSIQFDDTMNPLLPGQ